MPISVRHALTATTPDVTSGPLSGEIRPTHWNSQHLVSFNLDTSEVVKWFGAGASSISAGALSFSNTVGFSFGISTNSAGATITGSHNGLTAQSVQSQGISAFSAGGASVSAGMVVFSNANSMSFGISTSSNGATVTASFSVAAQTNQQLLWFASSQTTGQSSSSSMDARSISVRGMGGVSVGFSAGQLIISGAAGGAADGLNRLAAGSQTAGTLATVQFADSNGITWGMSGSNQITASHDGMRSHRVSASNGSSSLSQINFANANGFSFYLSQSSIHASADNVPVTHSGYFPFAGLQLSASQVGQGTLQVNPQSFPNLVFDRLFVPVAYTNATNSSGSHSLTFAVGIYTRNGSTLSLLTSATGSTAMTASGTQGNYSLFSGVRHFPLAISATLTEGRYWLAFVSSSASAAADASFSNMVAVNHNSGFQGEFGQSYNTTQQFTLGQGVYTAPTSGIPASIAFSHIRGSDPQANRFVALQFPFSTV